MSDFDAPGIDAKPGGFYVDQDSDIPDDDVPDNVTYTDGRNLFDMMSAQLGPGLTTLKPLTGRKRIP